MKLFLTLLILLFSVTIAETKMTTGMTTEIGYNSFSDQTYIEYDYIVYNNESYVYIESGDAACEILAIQGEGHGSQSIIVNGDWRGCLEGGMGIQFY